MKTAVINTKFPLFAFALFLLLLYPCYSYHRSRIAGIAVETDIQLDQVKNSIAASFRAQEDFLFHCDETSLSKYEIHQAWVAFRLPQTNPEFNRRETALAAIHRCERSFLALIDMERGENRVPSNSAAIRLDRNSRIFAQGLSSIRKSALDAEFGLAVEIAIYGIAAILLLIVFSMIVTAMISKNAVQRFHLAAAHRGVIIQGDFKNPVKEHEAMRATKG